MLHESVNMSLISAHFPSTPRWHVSALPSSEPAAVPWHASRSAITASAPKTRFERMAMRGLALGFTFTCHCHQDTNLSRNIWTAVTTATPKTRMARMATERGDVGAHSHLPLSPRQGGWRWVSLSHHQDLFLKFDLRLFYECPRVVLHKRLAKYGGDWLMGGVRPRKISAIHIKKLLFGYPSDNQDRFLIFLHQTCKTNSERSPRESKKNRKYEKQVSFGLRSCYRRVAEVYKTATLQVPKNHSCGQFKKRVIGS